MVASLLKMANLDWPVPDYTTLCRRQKTLAVQIVARHRFWDCATSLMVGDDVIEFALNNTHPIDFMLKRRGFSGHALQGFV